MGETGGHMERAPKGHRGGLRLLQLAAFFSTFDRFAIGPMLLTISASLGTSLAGVATASLYYRRHLIAQCLPLAVGPHPAPAGQVSLDAS